MPFIQNQSTAKKLLTHVQFFECLSFMFRIDRQQTPFLNLIRCSDITTENNIKIVDKASESFRTLNPCQKRVNMHVNVYSEIYITVRDMYIKK